MCGSSAGFPDGCDPLVPHGPLSVPDRGSLDPDFGEENKRNTTGMRGLAVSTLGLGAADIGKSILRLRG